MIILVGLLVLVAAVVVGVAGVAANTGDVRTDTSDFGVFDYHFTASAGELFLWGMAVGAIGMLGLTLLLAGVWRTSRRGSAARRELRRSRREVAAVRRDTPPAAPAVQPKQPVAAAVASERSTEGQPDRGQSIAREPASQKPVWSLNRFLPKSNDSAAVGTSRSPEKTPAVPASK